MSVVDQAKKISARCVVAVCRVGQDRVDVLQSVQAGNKPPRPPKIVFGSLKSDLSINFVVNSNLNL